MASKIRFRYIVNDVDKAVEFYKSNFDFELKEKYGPAIAILERDSVQLIVSGPRASASKPMPDGTKPVPGGWSRMVITIEDIEAAITRLKKNGVQFKNDLMDNKGRKQILCLDPSDNIIELFEQN